MALFGKKCAWCGMRLEGNGGLERMGKQFCSEGHANSYFEQMRAQNAPAQGGQRSGGCC